MRKEGTHKYETITGRIIDLSRLALREKSFLHGVLERFRARPDWTRFSAWWNKAFDAARLGTPSPAYRVCQDLEARLGIAQGRVSAPDYRDYLADLIEERYGSRYRFCKETGVDPGQLSRVFAGRADLSLQALQRLLAALGASVVVWPEKSVRDRAGIDRAAEALAGI